MKPKTDDDCRDLQRANAKAQAMLRNAIRKLHVILQDDNFLKETPMEVLAAAEMAVEGMTSALCCLESVALAKRSSAAPPGGPSCQQGQFLAFIREYMRRNQSGTAPSHANFQKFFNLTAPSVNSMLIRLEQRGFIRRISHKARAIELTIDQELIPPLDRPFRF